MLVDSRLSCEQNVEQQACVGHCTRPTRQRGRGAGAEYQKLVTECYAYRKSGKCMATE